MTLLRIGVDEEGEVVEDIDDAVLVYETDYDDDGTLVKSVMYRKIGAALPSE